MCCVSLLLGGSCPFGQRCVFLHDPRLVSTFQNKKICKIKVLSSSKSRPIKDSFFWPDMNTCNETDSSEQYYDIPAKFSLTYQQSGSHQHAHQQAHDRGVYSLWSHFIDLMEKIGHDEEDLLITPVNDAENQHLPTRSRLPVFVHLANGLPLQQPNTRKETYEKKEEIQFSVSPENSPRTSCGSSVDDEWNSIDRITESQTDWLFKDTPFITHAACTTINAVSFVKSVKSPLHTLKSRCVSKTK